jgi:hypothetical protein
MARQRYTNILNYTIFLIKFANNLYYLKWAFVYIDRVYKNNPFKKVIQYKVINNENKCFFVWSIQKN